MKRLSIAIAVGTAIAVLLVAAAPAVPTQADPRPEQENLALAVCGHGGKLTMLRVHDVGTGYGPPPGLDVEVVIRLDTEPESAFGFQLRNDSDRPVRQGMLDLLRDAFDNNWHVEIDEWCNGTIFRVWLTKP